MQKCGRDDCPLDLPPAYPGSNGPVIKGTTVELLAKCQLISKGRIKVFICNRNEQKYICISALAYKKRSNQKVVQVNQSQNEIL